MQSEPKTRTSVYLTDSNRRRLDQIPRGAKTALINEALTKALDEAEREAGAYADLMARLKALKPVKPSRASEVLLRELRERESRA